MKIEEPIRHLGAAGGGARRPGSQGGAASEPGAGN